MKWKTRIKGSALALIGYLLSPLSWWNDLFVNVPLALVFAWVISFFYAPAFEPSLIIGYWLTNVAGFVLMHKGANEFFSAENARYTRRELLRDIVISLLYTGLIVLLLELGVLKPFSGYFSRFSPGG